MTDLEKKNGQDTELQQDANYQQPNDVAANNGKETPKADKAPEKSNDQTLEMSDAEVAGKSVDELDKLIQQASQKPGARKENAEPPKQKEPEPQKAEKSQDKPAVKVKTPEGEDREIKSLEEAQKYNGRLTNEVGNLRKENENLNARLKLLETQLTKPAAAAPAETPEQKKLREQELQDKLLVDPKGVIKQVFEETEAEKRESDLKKQKARFENVKFIKERHPEILDQVKGTEIAKNVIDYLVEDGYTPEEINYIKRDPFGSIPPELLNLYVRIGKQQARIKELESAAASATKPQQDIVSKINAAANSASIIAKPGNGVPSVKGEVLSDEVINKLTPEEIDKKLKEYGKV